MYVYIIDHSSESNTSADERPSKVHRTDDQLLHVLDSRATPGVDPEVPEVILLQDCFDANPGLYRYVNMSVKMNLRIPYIVTENFQDLNETVKSCDAQSIILLGPKGCGKTIATVTLLLKLIKWQDCLLHYSFDSTKLGP